jgi:hypothetical protein
LRGIERADADAIGRELARDAQLDAIAGAIFLHRAGEMIGQRRRIALRGRVERTGAAPITIAPRRAAFFEHERDVIAARTARIGGIEARTRRVAHFGEQIQIAIAPRQSTRNFCASDAGPSACAYGRNALQSSA